MHFSPRAKEEIKKQQELERNQELERAESERLMEEAKKEVSIFCKILFFLFLVWIKTTCLQRYNIYTHYNQNR